MAKMNLGEYLRRRNLTRAEFAAQVGVSLSTLSRWLDADPNVRTRPTAELLARVETITAGRVTAASWDLPASSDGKAA